MGVNSVIISGRPAQDPVMKSSKRDGKLFCTFTLCYETFRGNGYPKKVEYFDVICFDKTAQNVRSHLRKGKFCTVQGRLSENKWSDADGQQHKNTIVTANLVDIHEWTSDEHSFDRGRHIPRDYEIESVPQEIAESVRKSVGITDIDLPDYV